MVRNEQSFLYEFANQLRVRVSQSIIGGADMEIVRLLQLALSSVDNDDLQGRASVQAALGMQLLSLQNVEEGMPLLVESASIFEKIGEPRDVAMSLSNLAKAFELSANFADAVQTYERLHDVHVKQQMFDAALNAQAEKANCLCSLSRAKEALALMEESVLPRLRKFGLTPSLANALCITARALADNDRKQDALNMYADAKRAFQALHKT
jgi:tetratricopeptide (TPR) repeat protein